MVPLQWLEFPLIDILSLPKHRKNWTISEMKAAACFLKNLLSEFLLWRIMEENFSTCTLVFVYQHMDEITYLNVKLWRLPMINWGMTKDLWSIIYYFCIIIWKPIDRRDARVKGQVKYSTCMDLQHRLSIRCILALMHIHSEQINIFWALSFVDILSLHFIFILLLLWST